MRVLVHGFALPFLVAVCAGSAVAQSGAAQHQNRPAAPKPGPHGAIPMPADRADDSYAIYSMLMPGQTLASLPAEQGAPWRIVSVTVNTEDRNPAVPPQGQLKPPPDNPTGFNETVSDYESNQHLRIQLEKNSFHVSHAFSLVAPDGAKSAGYPGLTYFSEVYFDTTHAAALVYMNEWCAELCSSGTWIYLEKQNGGWVRRSGIVVPGA
jgi:hypothetical protein